MNIWRLRKVYAASVIKSHLMNTKQPQSHSASNKPASQNHVNLELAMQSCMLADRFALRRKLRDVADCQKLKDEKSELKAQRLLAEIAQKYALHSKVCS